MQAQELLQQVSTLNNRTVMQDTCMALLTQTPDAIISQHLQAALTLEGKLFCPGLPCLATVVTPLCLWVIMHPEFDTLVLVYDCSQAKPSQAKPSQAKPSQAKPSHGQHIVSIC